MAKTEEQRLAYNAYMRAYIKRPEQVAKTRPRQTAYIAGVKANPEGRKKLSDQSKATHARFRKKHRERLRDERTFQRFGISRAEYDSRLASQNNICGMCHKPFDTSVELLKPVLDHRHKPWRLRDFLHRSCNLAIEHLQESVDNARFAIEYLERYSDGEQ